MSVIEHIRTRCTEDGDCWIWTLACSSNGTPKITHGDKPQRKQWAVRRLVATELGMADAIAGKLVTNKCGNPLCVCPDHILVVTKKRMADLIVERTGFPYRLERRAKIAARRREQSSKLNANMVVEIRQSSESLAEVAARLGIKKSLAGDVRRNATWRDYSSPWAGLGARK